MGEGGLVMSASNASVDGQHPLRIHPLVQNFVNPPGSQSAQITPGPNAGFSVFSQASGICTKGSTAQYLQKKAGAKRGRNTSNKNKVAA